MYQLDLGAQVIPEGVLFRLWHRNQRGRAMMERSKGLWRAH